MQIDGLDVQIIVGLEIHVQLATRTKMFCPCRVEFGAEPNSRTCPVCLGHPGTLPVMNRQAYEFAVRTALALNCQIARFTKWDRKSYYYPDLPKNYQISQYDLPLGANGWMEIPGMNGAQPPSAVPAAEGGGAGRFASGAQTGASVLHFQSGKRIRIRRAHLEEDAGKLLHEGHGPFSQVDLNRTGTPLLEIVTEPDMSSPREVGDFGRELRRLVRHLGVSEANMQMGQMRLEPNINCVIRTPDGKEVRTPIAEVKNLNSFKHVESAIEYEAHRQVAEWRRTGVTIVSGNKSTRGWDPDRGMTVLQREKEEAHDYRYFPDPDLAPVVIDDAWLNAISSTVVEAPAARRRRYIEQFDMDPRDADTLVEERANCDLFEAALAAQKNVSDTFSRRLVKLLLSEGNKRANERGISLAELPVAPAAWAELVNLLESGKISATAASAVLDEMLVGSTGAGSTGFQPVADAGWKPAPPGKPAPPESPEAIARRKGLMQTSDASAIEPIVDEVLAANAKAAEDARSGKKAERSLGFLIGQVMQRTRGTANPAMVRELLKKKLGIE